MSATAPKGVEQQPYADDLVVRDARRLYFERNNLGDGGYDKNWVKITVFGFTYYMPNPKARKQAVPYHDLNHVLTDYTADPHGECILAGYEVASGIDRFWLGWVISSQAMVLGLLFVPRGVFRAFVRGRRARGTYAMPYDEVLLARTVGDVRRELGIPSDVPNATAGDVLAFIRVCLITVIAHLLPAAAVAGVIWWIATR